MLVPANRFEVLECQAALDANYLGAQDTPPLGRIGALDVLAQHVLGMACAAPFDEDALFAEVTVRRALCRSDPGKISTASSPSSPPAAMR
jgi:Lhr-like helicase